MQLCAVSFLHKNGIMHRDIKSENVMLDDAMNAVLIDFSLASSRLRTATRRARLAATPRPPRP